MKDTRCIVRVLCALAALLPIALSSPAYSQNTARDELSVREKLSRERVFVGDELSYQVEVYGAADPQIERIDAPQGLKVIAHGRSFQSNSTTVIENGQRKQIRERRFVFQFTVTAQSEGEFTIPAPVIVDQSQRYRGKEVSFSSVLPTESLDDVLEISIDRTRLYQNEIIELDCRWWLGDNTSQFTFSSSQIPDSFEIRAAESARSSQMKIEFPFAGQMVTGLVSTGIHNGREMSSFSFRLSITPTETGTFELGPFRTLFTRQPDAGTRYRAYTESNTLRIEVVQVPEQGKPAGYGGAIGEYALQTRASNTRVHIGDPIELTLRIQGDEPLTGVRNPPALGDQVGFPGNFKFDSEGWRELTPRRPGVRTFHTTLRALNDSIDQIPAITLHAFDPGQGRYRAFASDPIPLEVQDAKEITLADALVNDDRGDYRSEPRRPTVERIELTQAAPGLWAHVPTHEMAQRKGFDVVRTLRQPVWVTAIATPPSCCFALFGLLAYRRRRNQERVRLGRAFRHAKRMETQRGLREYIARVLSINNDALVSADAGTLGVSSPLRDEVCAALMLQEGPVQPSGAEVDPTLLRRLHAELLLSVSMGGES